MSRGAAFGDLDNDGDVDIVVTNNNGPVRLLRNEIGSRRPSLTIELQPANGAGPAQGARVVVERRSAAALTRRLHTDSSYLSASDPRLHIGLGGSAATSIVVYWPSGRVERFAVPAQSRSVRLREGSGTAAR